MGTVAEYKYFFSAEDIAADLSISRDEAAGLVKELHKELKAAGYLVVSGKVPSTWYEQQKADGFRKKYAGYVPLAERRLLGIRDFCGYAGGIDQRSARRFVKEKGFAVQVGARMFVDRVRFDEWCTEQNCKGSGGNGPVDYGEAHIRTKSKKTGK